MKSRPEGLRRRASPGGPAQQGENAGGEQADQEAGAEQDAHGQEHGKRGLVGPAAAAVRASPRKEMPKTLTKQARAKAPIRARTGAAKTARPSPRASPHRRLEQPKVDEPLADEPVQGGQAADRHRTAEETEAGPGQLPQQAAVTVDLPGAGGMDHGAGAEKEERLEEAVVDDVQQGSAEPEDLSGADDSCVR